MNLIKENIKNNYRNGPDNIGRDFVGPCLSSAKLYRRGTGFFSSGALISYVEAIDNLVTEKTKIEIICSPVISDRTLLTTLENNQTEEMAEVELELTEEQFLRIAKMAHENDITFNKQIELILTHMIEEQENNV